MLHIVRKRSIDDTICIVYKEKLISNSGLLQAYEDILVLKIFKVTIVDFAHKFYKHPF